MGQGGYITLVNSTKSNWKKTNQNSYQMKSWNFPDVIQAKTAVNIYVEWDQGIFTHEADDAGEVNYSLDGTTNSFQVQARATNGFELKVLFTNLETYSNKQGTLFSLGWKHDGYVSFVLSGVDGKYSSTNLNGASWMQDNLSLLGNKKMNEICITGSHDAGMSVRTSGTPLAANCSVLTQSKSIQGQLESGARYFDIRPVISAGNYYTGHYGYIDKLSSWQGANGQSIDSIIADVNSFTSSQKELVVLNLSHSLNTDVGNGSYRAFNQGEWDNLFVKLANLENLFVADKSTDLTANTLSEFIASKAAVLVILEENASLGKYEGNGFFKYANFNVYNSYADKNQVDQMATNQFGKMKANNSKYFLLSWTLTQNAIQASTCVLGTASSIKDLASKANQQLADLVYPEVSNNAFPNIIYTDDILNSNAAAMAMALNWKEV